MSRAARLVVDRVMIEHMAHAGTENGNLAVTYADFVKFGIRRESLPAAIADAAARGSITITEQGRASTGPDRWPSRYARARMAPVTRWRADIEPLEGMEGPDRSRPIDGNIESSTDTGTREKGGKPRTLVPKTPRASNTGSGTGESRKSAIP